ncbi:MAG: CBASS cGAMP-activated phospholipase [Bacillota bacterium]
MERFAGPQRRILSIDGGGLKGFFPAAYLAHLEELTGQRVLDHFDLMVGTSTGAIIVLALSLGMPAREILDLYRDCGEQVFARSALAGEWGRRLRHILRPKYAAEPLMRVLGRSFGSRRLGEARCRLCIPSFNGSVDDVWVYKTAHHPKLRMDYRLPVVEVLRATTAAPTFFPAWRARSGASLVDGGVWANNPAMVGIVEALGVLDWPIEQLFMLSIGTTLHQAELSGVAAAGGILPWLWKQRLLHLPMGAHSRSISNMAGLLLKERYLRINPTVPEGRYSLDNTGTAGDLEAYGEWQARRSLDQVQRLFLSAPVQPFQPLYPLEAGEAPSPGMEEQPFGPDSAPSE